jgi:hypothetical protein
MQPDTTLSIHAHRSFRQSRPGRSYSLPEEDHSRGNISRIFVMNLMVFYQLSKGASNARADDSSSLKAKIISYLLVDTQASNALTLNRIGAKLDRGWEHPVTAALLCPLKYPATPELVLSFSFLGTAHLLFQDIYGHQSRFEACHRNLATSLPLP